MANDQEMSPSPCTISGSFQFPPIEENLPKYYFKRHTVLTKIASALMDGNLCIMSGESGIGKTVTASQFAEECTKTKQFKRVYKFNAADDHIEESLKNFVCTMGIDVPDDNSNKTLEGLFKDVGAKITQNGRNEDTLLIFDDAQEKLLMKYNEYVKDFKSLVVTKKKVDDLREFDNGVILEIDTFNDKEGLSAIKKFFDHHDLTCRDENLYGRLNDQTNGFPLALYQILSQITIKAKSSSNANQNIDEVLKECIDFKKENLEKEKINGTEDDPRLQIIGLILKHTFEKLKQKDEGSGNASEKPEKQTGNAAEHLFLIMSFLDINYLFEEMISNIPDQATNLKYKNALQELHEMGLFQYENR